MGVLLWHLYLMLASFPTHQLDSTGSKYTDSYGWVWLTAGGFDGDRLGTRLAGFVKRTEKCLAWEHIEVYAKFSRWGTDEKSIIQILGHRTAAQRKFIRQTYFQLYKEDLLKRLESELSSHFEKAVFRWVLDPAERDAVICHDAIKKWNANNISLLEISSARSSAELLMVRQAYHIRYKKSLEEDVAEHLSGNFRKLLVALVSSYRYEGPEVDMRLASSEAKKLNESITSRKDNYEELIRIISTRSKAQLNATFNCYKDVYGHHINKALKSEVPEDFQDAVRVVINCICCPVKHFAKILRLAIERHGRDEDALTRVVVTRAEVDLKDIKESYAKRTSKTLEHAIASDTSGDYRNFLLTLIGKDHA